MTFTASQSAAIAQAAGRLGVDVSWLVALISYESGFNPSAKNPSSSARGLIQWIDSRARELGYSSSADLVAKHPTIESQLLGPVVRDLSRYAPFPTFEKLVAAVFHPADVSDFDRPLSAAESAVNAGIRSVKDYADRIRKRYPVEVVGAGLGIGFLVFAGVAFWIWNKSKKG